MTPLLSYDPPIVGAYRLLGRLGSGGQGDVFLSVDPHSGGYVAVKTVRLDGFDDPGTRQRFARELAVAGRVRQFCTARILASGLDGDMPYVVSEYVPGRNLYQHVTQVGTIVGDDLERLAVGTIAALTAIHKAGVVHCDFKPDNVILGPFGPRVIDFGIAQALDNADSTTIRGYPPYMAPERIAGAPARPACDVFAWAATIAFAASGRPPFGRYPAVEQYRRIHESPPDIAGMPASLEELIRECLDKDEHRRPAAHRVLFRLLGEEPEPTLPLEALLQMGSEEAGQLRPDPPVPARRSTGSTGLSHLRREARNGRGIVFAMVFGALSAAVGYQASRASGTAAATVGTATFALVYLARLLLATILRARP